MNILIGVYRDVRPKIRPEGSTQWSGAESQRGVLEASSVDTRLRRSGLDEKAGGNGGFPHDSHHPGHVSRDESTDSTPSSSSTSPISESTTASGGATLTSPYDPTNTSNTSTTITGSSTVWSSTATTTSNAPSSSTFDSSTNGVSTSSSYDISSLPSTFLSTTLPSGNPALPSDLPSSPQSRVSASHGLSKGSIIGIAIGSFVFLLMVILSLLALRQRLLSRKRLRMPPSAEFMNPTAREQFRPMLMTHVRGEKSLSVDSNAGNMGALPAAAVNGHGRWGSVGSVGTGMGAPPQDRMSTGYGHENAGEIGLAISGDEYQGRSSPLPRWMQPQRINSMTPIMDPSARFPESDAEPPSTDSSGHAAFHGSHGERQRVQSLGEDNRLRGLPVEDNWAGRGASGGVGGRPRDSDFLRMD